MITSSRIRGMFVGLLEEGDRNIPDMTLSILSIILLNSSNALENYKLFNLVREINDNLQKEENYKMLFEAAPDGVEVLDAKGNIVDCNKAQTILLGYKREELIGNNTTKFLLNYSTTSFKKKHELEG
ncbi:MAG: PAS domain-containing protein [Candidatus Desulfaltia sp.]|nr:PAS domain-containing protein [Candidatus Desulfaltia sp.]